MTVREEKFYAVIGVDILGFKILQVSSLRIVQIKHVKARTGKDQEASGSRTHGKAKRLRQKPEVNPVNR